jgi:hypothetical protein
MQGSRTRTLEMHAESRFQNLDSRMCGRPGRVESLSSVYTRLPISITPLSVICRPSTARHRLRNIPHLWLSRLLGLRHADAKIGSE